MHFHHSFRNNLKHRFFFNLVIFGTILTIASCSKQESETIRSFKDVSKVPTLLTKNVSSLISDSGITRYRLVADEWAIFERSAEAYWSFPKGIYVEKFDSALHVEASIKADSAFFYVPRKLWRLKKNVKILNLVGETFETDELFWDQYQQKIYSNKQIKINQISKIITGIGFESNEQMTSYKIHKIQGIFYINDSK
ncbi:LPS export ABC transporter periplasmic protein LptC [Parabacteroides sp. FAFU027]|uniref:LPS export ABC transporter periplasmic protein LptC n=1 Tax=Parabacteroides sp. FAFU027 TaxID=2922715 RepID=UPI001FAF0AC6|nr:LPS export ABC transporter periplasmic protein LptC [Parabacteroides sp. FAFU027]